MPRPKVEGLARVVAGGDRRASLIALRDHLARELENPVPGIAIGPIAKELRAVIAEIDGIPGAREGSKSDELAAKRAAKHAESARGAASAGQ